MRAGTVAEIARDSGDWVFVDIGFSSKSKTSGWLVNDAEPIALAFSELRQRLVDLTKSEGPALNLVLEAPLSVAFSREGNPIGRQMERSGAAHRYWYAGTGCQITLAAAYLLSAARNAKCVRDIRLFEAFVSFKPKGARTSHVADVLAIRSVVWDLAKHAEHIISPEALREHGETTLESAFIVFGFDCGVPPVICAPDKAILQPSDVITLHRGRRMVVP